MIPLYPEDHQIADDMKLKTSFFFLIAFINGRSNYKIERKEFYKKLWTLVLPIASQNFMSAAVSASDAIMLGVIDQDALSAVSLAGQIQFVLSLFSMALTIGTTILAAQYWGKGDKKTLEKILAFVLKLSLGISLIFFFAAELFPVQLMRIFTTDALLIESGARYLKTVGVSYVFMGASQIYLCMMKNSGQTLKSTIISAAAMLLNLLLNGIFIFGFWVFPAMGIFGAALATVIARAIEILWTFGESLRKNRIQLRIKYLWHNERMLKKDFYRYTMPVLGNSLVWGCGFTMYSVIMGHLGSDAVAANSIANIMKNLIACVCMGIGSGGGILVGNELGKGALKMAKLYGDKLCKVAIFSGFISGGMLLVLSPFIIKLANLSVTAQGYLKSMLFMCAYYLIGKAINSTVIAGILCAGGDSRFGFICDTITMWAVTVPLGALAAFHLNLPVPIIYFILSLDEFVKLPAVYRHYKKYGWVKDLTRSELI